MILYDNHIYILKKGLTHICNRHNSDNLKRIVHDEIVLLLLEFQVGCCANSL